MLILEPRRGEDSRDLVPVVAGRRVGVGMRLRFHTTVLALAIFLAAASPWLLGTAAGGMSLDGLPYVPFVPTPEAVVDEMLEIARVSAADIVYDLGSGDGRIVIAAAKRFGARGVGVEIDPELIREATENAEQAGVTHRVRFVEGDFFTADIREATVVTLYLLPEVNRQLLPKLLAELRPGTRIVSYKYDLGDWAPEKTVRVSRGTVYYWVVPPGGGQRD
jgi:SAM-dependent methyltransferase